MFGCGTLDCSIQRARVSVATTNWSSFERRTLPRSVAPKPCNAMGRCSSGAAEPFVGAGNPVISDICAMRSNVHHPYPSRPASEKPPLAK
jgi:hypothetical protein